MWHNAKVGEHAVLGDRLVLLLAQIYCTKLQAAVGLHTTGAVKGGGRQEVINLLMEKLKHIFCFQLEEAVLR